MLEHDYELVQKIKRLDWLDDTSPLWGLTVKNKGDMKLVTSMLAENFTKAIIELNMIEPGEFYEFDGISISSGPIGVEYEEFRAISNLDWESEDSVNKDIVLFRYRFLSLLMIRFQRILRKLGKYKYENSSYYTGYTEYSFQFLYEAVDDLKHFAYAFLESNDFKNSLIRTHQNISYIQKDINVVKYNKKVYDVLTKVEKMLDEDVVDDSVKIDCVFKLAYTLTTFNTSFEDLPKFKKISKHGLNDNLGKLIFELGAAILNHGDDYIHPMFIDFLTCKAQIPTKFVNVNDSNELFIGVCAIYFSSFVMNDRRYDAIANVII